MQPNLRFLLTGAPGAGKTTVLHHLRELGYAGVPEVAREIIRARRERGLPPRPDPATFATEIYERDRAQYDATSVGDAPVFFDRGTPDSLLMMEECGVIDRAEVLRRLAERPYHPHAFFFPTWDAIYRPDAERDQTLERSREVSEAIRAGYASLGFTLETVPEQDPEVRAAWVLQRALELLRG